MSQPGVNPFNDIFDSPLFVNLNDADRLDLVISTFKNAATPEEKDKAVQDYADFKAHIKVKREHLAQDVVKAIDIEPLSGLTPGILDGTAQDVRAAFNQLATVNKKLTLQAKGLLDSTRGNDSIIKAYEVLVDAEGRLPPIGDAPQGDTAKALLSLKEANIRVWDLRDSTMDVLAKTASQLAVYKSVLDGERESEFQRIAFRNSIRNGLRTDRPVKALKPATFGLQHI